MNKQTFIGNTLEAEIGQEFEGRDNSASQAGIVDAIKNQLKSDLKTRKYAQAASSNFVWHESRP